MLKYLPNLQLVIASLELADSTSSFSCSGFTRIEGHSSLNVIVIVSLPDEDYDPTFDQGYSIIPAVELAAKQINRRADILSNLDLVPKIKDAGCDRPSKTLLWRR